MSTPSSTSRDHAKGVSLDDGSGRLSRAAWGRLTGLGFGLAYGPLNIAATSGIAPEEQGLAGGLVNTSFQFGGALVLAILTAVNNAVVDGSGAAGALLDGFHAAIVVSLIAALLVTAVTFRGRRLALEPA